MQEDNKQTSNFQTEYAEKAYDLDFNIPKGGSLLFEVDSNINYKQLISSCPPVLPNHWPSWEALMLEAIQEAKLAISKDEVPVGAIIVSKKGEILAKAHNTTINKSDPTAHAEIEVIRKAGQVLNNYRLSETILVVTLEPCLMCVGAAIHARLGGIVYGAKDPKTGAVESCFNALSLPFHNHQIPSLGEIRAKECGQLLSDFFKNKRTEQQK